MRGNRVGAVGRQRVLITRNLTCNGNIEGGERGKYGGDDDDNILSSSMYSI
jgi:hypothetical protein